MERFLAPEQGRPRRVLSAGRACPRAPFVYPIVDAAALGGRARGATWWRALAAGGRAAASSSGPRASATARCWSWRARRWRRPARPGALLVVNDRADVARMAGADGVHVGQDDLAARRRAARLLGPARWSALSTHDLAQLAAAARAPVDYVAVGPVFATAQQGATRPGGRARLRARGARAPARPAGRHRRHHAARTRADGGRGAGADGVAVDLRSCCGARRPADARSAPLAAAAAASPRVTGRARAARRAPLLPPAGRRVPAAAPARARGPDLTYYFRDFTVTFYPLRLFWARELAGRALAAVEPLRQRGRFVLPVALSRRTCCTRCAPGPAAVSWLLTLHFPLAALAAYVLARDLGVGRAGAFVAGGVFSMGGLAVSSLNLYVFLQALALAPLVVLALRRAALRGGRWVAAAAGVVAVSLTTLAVEFVAQAVAARPGPRPAWTRAPGARRRAPGRGLRARGRPGRRAAAGHGRHPAARACAARASRARSRSATSSIPAVLLQALVPDLFGSLPRPWRLVGRPLLQQGLSLLPEPLPRPAARWPWPRPA